MAVLVVFTILWALAAKVLAGAANKSVLVSFPDKPRVFILADIAR
jgi:hypothetical protein